MKIERLEELKSLPEPRELTPDEVKEAYALARAAFTAGDLQRFTELDPGVSMEDFLRELEEAQKGHRRQVAMEQVIVGDQAALGTTQ